MTEETVPFTCPNCGPVSYKQTEVDPETYDSELGDGDIICKKCKHWLSTYFGK